MIGRQDSYDYFSAAVHLFGLRSVPGVFHSLAVQQIHQTHQQN